MTNIAVITGAGSGMGLACAQRFAKSHRLVLVDTNMARLEAVVEALRTAEHSPVPMVTDVTDPAAIASLVSQVEKLGQFSVLVNAAGLSPTMADGRRVMEVNLVGTALIERGFVKLAAPGSVAILIASNSAYMHGYGARQDKALTQPLAPGFWEDVAADLENAGGAYALSKRGVILYTRKVAPEWGAFGGRVVSISPGLIDTPMGQREIKAHPFMNTMLEQTPLKRWGRPEEIAATAAFLASPDASFITGIDILVDGGGTWQLPE